MAHWPAEYQMREPRTPARLWQAGGLLMMLLAAAPAAALCGDLSGDGRVNATDALLTLRAAVFDLPYQGHADIDAGQGSDGSLSATDALMVLRAAVFASLLDCASAVETRAVVSTASCDFATGGVAEVDLASRSLTGHQPAVSAADAVARVQMGRVFILNRFGGDNIQELDPSSSMALIAQCSLGNGSNPHDVVLVSETLGYVSRYDSTSLAVIDPSAMADCQGFITDTIDLSPWADADGFPEMDQMALAGDRLLVSLQRLDRNSFFQPTGAAMLVAIDTATNEVVAELELAVTNPFAETKGLLYDPENDLVYIAGPGTLFSDLDDGGIEAVDTRSLASLGLIADGADLGGDLTDLVVAGGSKAYAIVASEGFANSLVEVNLEQATISEPLATSDYLFSDIELTENGRLWLADRNCFDPGLRVFSSADNAEITTAPLYPGLTPFTLAFVD